MENIIMIIIGCILSLVFFTCLFMIIYLSFTGNKNKDEIYNLSLMCFFNKISHLSQINDFTYNILINLCKKENVYFFEVNDNIINKDVDDKKANGKYIYLKGYTLIEMLQTTDKCKKLFKNEIESHTRNEIEFSYPRILINNESPYYKKFKITTLAHELGHHYLNIRNLENSEINADKYVLSIFYENLPECFLGIFYNMLEVITKIDEHIITDFKDMYNKYLMFREEHPELNLPTFYDNF